MEQQTRHTSLSEQEKGDDDEIVICSQEERLESSQNDEWGVDFKAKASEIFSLYEKFSGQKCKRPGKSTCLQRDEYRELFCVGNVCEKLGALLSSRLESNRRLITIREQSLNQMKALCMKLEASIEEDSAFEKYFSFDDTCQRDTLEIMGIRYEELTDDISSDEEFVSLFDDGEMNKEDLDEDHNLPTSSSCLSMGAVYSEICQRSKLTEVGLRYVNNIYKLMRSMKLKVVGYRTQITQCAKMLRSTEEKLNRIREEIGFLPPIALRMLGFNQVQGRKPLIKKAYSN